MTDMKMQDVKLTDEFAGHEIARHKSEPQVLYYRITGNACLAITSVTS